MSSAYEDGICPSDGGALVFDPDFVGMTVGGLQLRGCNRCPTCGATWISKRSREGGGPWKLTGSGRSIDADGVRIRAEGKPAAGSVPALMERIARLPDFERALADISDLPIEDPAATLDRVRVIARAALSPKEPPP